MVVIMQACKHVVNVKSEFVWRVYMQKYLVWMGICLAATLGSVAWHNKQVYESYRAGYSEGQKETAGIYEKQIREDKDLAEKKNKKLIEEHIDAFEQLQIKKDFVDGQLAVAYSELRTRPTRKDLALAQRSCAANSEAQSSFTGAGLPREDAEFLAGEAAYATMIQNERDYYYGELQRIHETTTGAASGLDGSKPNAEPVSGTRLSP